MSQTGMENNLYTADQFIEIFGSVIADALKRLRELPPVDIVRCKDCRKHNISTDVERNICPLTWFRGKAQGHEFDEQFCVYGERKDQ